MIFGELKLIGNLLLDNEIVSFFLVEFTPRTNVDTTIRAVVPLVNPVSVLENWTVSKNC